MGLFSKIDEKADELKDTFGVRLQPWPLFILGLALLFMAAVFMPKVVSLALSMALFLAPLWLPVLIIGSAWTIWVIFRRSEFTAKQKHVLLEIKPPRNLVKTPLAMEAFLSGLHIGGGEGTWYIKYWKGATRPWFSLEIASFEGQVHFYIWTRANFRRLIEAQMYAQYPGTQIVEAQDYTRFLTATPEEWSIWGCDFKYTEKDPIPIKTYVEYGLDKVQKEPEQVDPLANLVEFMGSMRKGEYLWLQLVIRMHKGEKYNKLNKAGKPYTWKDEALELVANIRKETRDPYVDPVTGEERPGFPNPTKGQSEKIAAIERNVSKLAFDVGARAVYIVEQGKFDVTVIAGMTGLFKQFSSEGWNGMKHTGWLAKFDDYPWEIGAAKLKDHFRRGIIDAYRRRQFFYEPAVGKEMVMSTEELATIFHIPSRAVETPSLERIQSATSEAPANLPL
ncbi:hypothetical protein A3G63_02850 [Candidatus Kaiserbacteria bacterium RIFCSPLOWO2_12_FULL_52_8]|uniref:DUF8128 domain-containing protein n=1 Tax=Candidatus Kaiserbacteria bacterium RIFCSPHIGHO2_01_FULL_53_31 TaxID=1798481 RepID=A0A1F6CI11_9BACT|nr:MAG: hypothetical protein A2678_01960 [Candidatus Kaiserbacteria bacterium RIFCSPHIGHO2_01_FULL_53_31]OGG92861.1 MAG: hypothetical protein A3G63_02850 [Candidatus Kaiserbacteria bacterium RIFCSPLOWO2_12_FULL_52_8]